MTPVKMIWVLEGVLYYCSGRRGERGSGGMGDNNGQVCNRKAASLRVAADIVIHTCASSEKPVDYVRRYTKNISLRQRLKINIYPNMVRLSVLIEESQLHGFVRPSWTDFFQSRFRVMPLCGGPHVQIIQTSFTNGSWEIEREREMKAHGSLSQGGGRGEGEKKKKKSLPGGENGM